MAEDGLVELAGPTVRITERGRPLIRSVAAVFDGYLASAPARHSRAV
jgi:oxygen-independent coproporphyrinogen-3 oxidase